MKRLVLVLATAVALTVSFVPAQAADEKHEEIVKMLKITGVEKMMTQMVSQMVSTFKSKETGVPDAFWTKLEASLDAKGMIEKLIPVYDKHYSLEDLKAVNAFYSTPAGQHLLASMPEVMQESMAIGQAWGQQAAQDVMKALEAEKKK